MDFRKFNEVAELVGIVAIVASLVFVGLRLRQSQEIALADLKASFASASIEIASLIADNSEVWAKGIAGEVLDESDDSVVHSFAAFLHRRPGARRVWVAREEHLKADREAIDPWSVSLASNYVETILADLALLDSKEN